MLRMTTTELVIQYDCDREIKKILHSSSNHCYIFNNLIVHKPWLFHDVSFYCLSGIRTEK
jgi:hypothetical protein